MQKVGKIVKMEKSSIPKVYTCFNKDDEILRKSSSGGVFYLLGKRVIELNGVVFGARFDENWEVVHDNTDCLQKLDQYLGSKYLQSKVGNAYGKAQAFLETGRLVLFSGTPCQIKGLESFLGKKYENLVTVGVRCHGVASVVVWKKYLEKCRKAESIKSINFRDKKDGWLDYSLKIDMNNGEVYQRPRNIDVFMRGYIQGAFLRPSCYECNFSRDKNVADIILGDFWSVASDCPDMYNSLGTSIVLTNSDKGEEILHSINDSMKILPLNYTKSQIEKFFDVPHLKPNYRDEIFERPDDQILDFCRKKTVPNYRVIIKKYIKKRIRGLIKREK